MYCKNCGTDINNYKYCPNCGTKRLTKNQEYDKKVFKLGMFLIISFILIGIISQNFENGEFTLFKKDVTRNDMSIETYIDYDTLSISLLIRANKNIKGLKLEFLYFDENYNLISSNTKYIGDIKKNDEKEIRIYVTDFTISEMIKIKDVEIEIIEGKTSIFE